MPRPALPCSDSLRSNSSVLADVRLGSNRTSNVTIQDNDSPYGVLSFSTVSVTVSENVSIVNIVVTRSGGTFGNVGAQVRTIGGGETWSIVGTQIEDVLSKRNKSKIAHMGTDYFDVNTRVNFKVDIASDNKEKP